jgi:hypothetical protein
MLGRLKNQSSVLAASVLALDHPRFGFLNSNLSPLVDLRQSVSAP